MLVIHGIGSQRPLEVLRAAADAIYSKDESFGVRDPATTPDLWLTFDGGDPDQDLDLPVLTTGNIAPSGTAPHYVDFHECYWAYIMSETRFVAVPLWLMELIRKGPALMRPGIRALWPGVAAIFDLILVAVAFLALSPAFWVAGEHPAAPWGAIAAWSLATMAAGFLAGKNAVFMMAGVFLVSLCLDQLVRRLFGLGEPWIGTVLPLTIGDPVAIWATMGIVMLAVLANVFVLLTVVGDAARYYRAAPANIAVRRSARKLAINRLRTLHGDSRYDRIIVVAHSLGTVIGYDMLRAYWSEGCHDLGDPSGDPLFNAQNAEGANGAPFDEDRWRSLKAALRARLPGLPRQSRTPRRWLVTDFITLGSPLTHARFLMADGRTAEALRRSFHRKRLERELPQDPAWHVGSDGSLIFALQAIGRSFLHSGAMFGLIRWTNIYFPLRQAIMGDVVGGPVKDVFGPGVEDVEVRFGAFARVTAHVQYFNTHDPHAEHLAKLREAVDLKRDRLGRDLARGNADQAGAPRMQG